MKERRMRQCEFVYVKEKKGGGWKWRAVAEGERAPTTLSQKTYHLFYECVIAARASGYTPVPALKCL
jgi:hypothetical protein